MPVVSTPAPGGQVLVTEFSGTVTNDELLRHYVGLLGEGRLRPGMGELVDSRAVVNWLVTAEGEWRLATIVQEYEGRLAGVRVAMVASSEVIYGMFRMWQLVREHLPYEVQVFRDMAPARAWLGLPAEETAEEARTAAV